MKTPADLYKILRKPYTLDEDDKENSDMNAMRLKYLGPDWANLVMGLLFVSQAPGSWMLRQLTPSMQTTPVRNPHSVQE